MSEDVFVLGANRVMDRLYYRLTCSKCKLDFEPEFEEIFLF